MLIESTIQLIPIAKLQPIILLQTAYITICCSALTIVRGGFELIFKAAALY